jgi:hypothetical protein
MQDLRKILWDVKCVYRKCKNSSSNSSCNIVEEGWGSLAINM